MFENRTVFFGLTEHNKRKNERLNNLFSKKKKKNVYTYSCKSNIFV